MSNIKVFAMQDRQVGSPLDRQTRLMTYIHLILIWINNNQDGMSVFRRQRVKTKINKLTMGLVLSLRSECLFHLIYKMTDLEEVERIFAVVSCCLSFFHPVH